MAQVTHFPPIPESLPFPPVSIYTEREKTGPKNSRNGRKRDKTGHRPKHAERAYMELNLSTKVTASARGFAPPMRDLAGWDASAAFASTAACGAGTNGPARVGLKPGRRWLSVVR
jgi:hypothetical protein